MATYLQVSSDSIPVFLVEVSDEVHDMGDPVQCRWCGRCYDLRSVTVRQRYADCTVFEAGCCGKIVDDRGMDYRTIDKKKLIGAG